MQEGGYRKLIGGAAGGEGEGRWWPRGDPNLTAIEIGGKDYWLEVFFFSKLACICSYRNLDAMNKLVPFHPYLPSYNK